MSDLPRHTDPIGFFDSGVGGLCIRDACRALLPHESTLYLADSANCPYGNKPPEEILALAREHVRWLLYRRAKLIVVACNTATAAAIDAIRSEWPDVPFVGLEPAVKPAALNSKTGVVGVLATAGTFHGRLYRETCARFARHTTVIMCVADDFVTLVEKGEVTGPHALEVVRRHVAPLMAAGADHLVLGCTHFPHLKPLIEEVVCGRAVILDPAPAVAQQVKRLLEARHLCAPEDAVAGHVFVRTGQRERKNALRQAMRLRRRAVTQEERKEKSAALCRALLARRDLARVTAARLPVAVYLAGTEELDLSDFMAALVRSGTPVVAPRWNGRAYDLARWDPAALRMGPHGILEPAEASLVAPGAVGAWIVPGLAFTAAGARLGYGGGWYDRFLTAARPDALTLGVGYAFQMVEDLPLEPHDHPLDGVVCADAAFQA